MKSDKIIRKIQKYPKTLEQLIPFRRFRSVAVYVRVSTSSDEQINSFEAQKEYYQKYITERPEWIFCELYSDEGISGTSKKHRDGFNKMMEDAETGEFDLIITKSISRFARNTVDSLICIRRLKEIGIEVYFEKEDLWTFDSKGEFMLTLLSSLAQEESRSISENVAWGCRKRFADGKYFVPYKHFLGYDKGISGGLVVNPYQALIVKLIYKLYLEGKTLFGIKNYLDDNGIPTPSGKTGWSQTVLISILTNEKYKGDALLQKNFIYDFLTKKSIKNNGELPQYYVTDGHEPIIPRETFDYTQELIKERHDEYGRRFSCARTLAAKIQCGDCGAYYGLKSSHSGTWKHADWYCNDRYRNGSVCRSPRIRDEYMEGLCYKAIQHLLQSRADVFNILKKSLLPCLKSNASQMDNSIRLNNVEEYIACLKNSSQHITLSDEVQSVVIKIIVATADGRLVFQFLNDDTYEINLLKYKNT